MSNIRTIAYIRQDEHSVESISLRGTTEDVSTQITTLAPRSILNDDLREIARERLNNNDLRLPIRTNANGFLVGDAQDIRNLNESLDEETIRSTLEVISENRFNPEMIINIVSNMPLETQERMRNILSQPNYDLISLTPILNTIIYANVSFYDFHSSIPNLANLLAELNSPENLYENNLEEVEEIMDRHTNEANSNSDERNETYGRERSNILNSLNWRTILRRSGTLLITGFATYMGAPYMGALGNLGIRLLENSPNLSSSFSNGTDIVPRDPTSRTTWNDVSGSFWNSWSLFARYMGRRSD
jgi:DNA-binding TFAR19-related protein (PDSD5 family)